VSYKTYNSFNIWDLETGQEKHSLKGLEKRTVEDAGISISPDSIFIFIVFNCLPTA